MKKLFTFLMVIVCIVLIGKTADAQVPILYYDFEQNASRGTFENAVELNINSGSGALTKSAALGTLGGVSGAGTFNGGSTSGQAITANTWSSSTTDPGTGSTNYMQFIVNTTGFNGISVSFNNQASNTGPARVGILWSTDGVTFNTATTSPVLTGANTMSASGFILLPAGADNSSTVTIRVYAYAGSAGDRSGRSAFASGGTFRIDNLTVYGSTLVSSKTLINEATYYTGFTSGLTSTILSRGSFTINSGATATSSSNLSFSTGSTLTVNNGGTLTLAANTLTGTGTAAFAGTGTISLNALSQVSGFANTFSGTYSLTGSNPNVPAGTYGGLTVGSGGATLTGAVVVSGQLGLNGALVVGANTLTISGTISRTSGNIDASNSSAIITFANTSAITLPTGLFSGNIGNLRMNSSNFVTSTDDITVSNTLTLDNGWLRMGSNTLGVLTIGTSTSNLGSIVRNGGGQVNGSIRRWVDNSTGARIFPVGFYHWVTGSGYANDYVEYNLNFTSAPASGGTITVRFDTTGSGALPETDPTGHPGQYYIPFTPIPGVNMINLTPQYWTVSTGNGFDLGVSGRYSLDLTLNGMGVSTTAYQYTAIVKRTNNLQPWAVDFTNNHIQTTNPSGNTPLAHGQEFDSFSEFAIAGNMDNLLPVELTSFTASVNGNTSTLNWSTVSEENNSGFDIERKSGTGSWSKIGFVEGHGTVNTPSSYIYTDRNLVSGKYNYRLKQIDFNGNYKYYELSNEVIIGTPTKYALSQNFPNPFNPSTTISYEIPASNFVSLKIYDMMGKEVANLVNATQEAGFYTVKFDASKLASGVYFYKLQANDFTATKKLMLMK